MRKTTLLLILVLPLLAIGNRHFRSFVTFGQGPGLAAPTDVAASDNSYSTKVGISWNAIFGATTYRVFRSTTNNSAAAIDVGATSAFQFFDASAVAGQNYFYWVRAENGSTLSPLSTPDQGVRANGTIGPLPPLNPPPAPLGNQVTAAKAYLGKALFWDEQLSSTRTVACGTCHFSTNGGSDARALVNNPRSTNPGADGVFGTADDVFASPGVPSNNVDGTFNWSSVYGFKEQVTGRKAKSYIDAAYAQLLFWDGRASNVFTDPISGQVVLQNGAALESQVLGPPVSSTEMAHQLRDWNDVANRVAGSTPLALTASMPTGLKDWIGTRTYPELFTEAFGSSDVTPARIAMAIATFERTVYSDRTPFDIVAGGIANFNPPEQRGQGVFNASRCNVCHAGPLLSDNIFHNIGVRPQNEDTGRFQVTGQVNNIGEFRTPSLRNVGLRGPYFHNGRFATLEEVVAFYNRGGDFPQAPNIDHQLIRPLGLSPQQQSDLVAFLRNGLTDPRAATGAAPFDRPTLYTETARVPQITGNGAAGSGGGTPAMLAIEPPLLGNPSFAVGISNALGNANAVLVVDSNDSGPGPFIPPTGSLGRFNIQLNGSGAGQGWGSVHFAIPDNPALIGGTFYGRWYVTDPGAPGGVSSTPAFKITIFGPPNSSAATTNPIDDASSFVRQNYLDFLSREPDQGGLDYWVSQFALCNGDAACIRQKRIDVSAAYFMSAEFQESGGFIYDMYAGSLGRSPAYNEFVPDRAQVVGGTGLEQAKIVFANSFIQRSEFLAKYPAAMTPDQFVDALLLTMTQRSGADVSSLRNQLLSDYGTGGRSLVVRDAIQSTTFVQAEYNKAFVLMEYYGYLRRGVDQAGYDFWLNVLNTGSANDYRGMVCSFLTSAEYQLRFGALVTHSNQECAGQ